MTNRRRIYSVPRGRIVTPLPSVTVAPPPLTPRFTHTYVRAITYQRRRVFSPPFSSATTWPPVFVRAAGRPPALRAQRSRINNYIPTILPPPGPAPLVPEFRRTRVISLRGLRTPRSTSVIPLPIILPPPPLPGPPRSSGGIVKDFLHWWRIGSED